MEFLLIKEEGSEKKFLIESRVVTIGRSGKNDISLRDRNSSRQHCNILKVGDNWFVVDCESHNGTYVNDERVKKRELKEGDKISIGAVEIVFSLGGKAVDAVPEYKKEEEIDRAAENTAKKTPQSLESDSDDVEEPEEEEKPEQTGKTHKPRQIRPTQRAIPQVTERPAPEEKSPKPLEIGNGPEEARKKDLGRVKDFYHNFQSRLSWQEIGQETFAERFMTALLCGGHCLLQGDSTIVSQVLAQRIAAILGLSCQCYFGSGHRGITPNAHLLFLENVPADEVSSHLCRQSPGLGAEKLPLPWMAILNERSPGEFSTFLLHSFLFPIPLPSLTLEQEAALMQMSLKSPGTSRAILSPHQLLSLQALIEDVEVPNSTVKYTAQIIRATRPDGEEMPPALAGKITRGLTPVVGVWVMKAARVRAALDGREVTMAEDIQEVSRYLIPPRLDIAEEIPENDEIAQGLFQTILDFVEENSV